MSILGKFLYINTTLVCSKDPYGDNMIKHDKAASEFTSEETADISGAVQWPPIPPAQPLTPVRPAK